MSGTCMSIARLSERQLAKLRELEEDLGTPLIAVESKCHWTDLDEDRLRKLREAEEEMGVLLLAYEPE